MRRDKAQSCDVLKMSRLLVFGSSERKFALLYWHCAVLVTVDLHGSGADKRSKFDRGAYQCV